VVGPGTYVVVEYAAVDEARPHRLFAIAGLAGAVWAAVLLPPQLVAWDGAAAVGWARRLDTSVPVYGWVRDGATALGISDWYAFFGAAVAPSFALIGIALVPVARRVGRTGALLAGLTLLGAPLIVGSYLAHDLERPWRYLWGSEMILLLAIGIAGIVAGFVASRKPGIARWWALLLGATPAILVGSTAVFTYIAHGTLVGFGLEAAALSVGVRGGRPRS
jgi:hypothetical protein